MNRDILACPACKSSSMSFGPDAVYCPDCGRKYPIGRHDGADIIDFIPDSAARFQNPVQKLWRYLLATSAAEEQNLFDGLRSFDAYDAQHAECYDLTSGRVLDIGGGSGVLRRCLGSACEYVDVEPDTGAYARRSSLGKLDSRLAAPFAFFRGVAEYLPFRARTFDIAVMDGMIEHVFDLNCAFSEAFRVLKSGGVLYLAADCHGQVVRSGRVSVFRKTLNYCRRAGIIATVKRAVSRAFFEMRRRMNPWKDVLDFSEPQVENGHIYDDLRAHDIIGIAEQFGFRLEKSQESGLATVIEFVKP